MTEVLLECPKCAGAMEKVDAGSCIVDRCRGCRGIWFDAGELTRVLSSKARVKLVDTGSVPNIQVVVNESRHPLFEPGQAPRGVAVRSEEVRAHVVVHAVHF